MEAQIALFGGAIRTHTTDKPFPTPRPSTLQSFHTLSFIGPVEMAAPAEQSTHVVPGKHLGAWAEFHQAACPWGKKGKWNQQSSDFDVL